MSRYIVDMHCDTISELLKGKREGRTCSLRRNHGHLDLERMKESGYLLQNFALFVDKENCGDPWEEVCALEELYQQEMKANSDLIRPVLHYRDIAANEEAGCMSAMLTAEEGAVCRGSLSRLDTLYERGVRMLTLTWNYPNELGYPNLDAGCGKEVWKACRELKNRERSDREMVRELFESYFYTPEGTGGLTECGREFAERMECLGMILDVSHLSDRGFYDVLECTRRPFVASHSNARAVCRCVRNLSDDMIRRLAERGGCMGLNYCADFLEEPVIGKENPGTLQAAVSHAKHIANTGGIEVLGLGSDFDGIDTNRELPDVCGMERLWEALHRGGFSQRQLDLIFHGNVLRVYRDILS